MLFIYMSDTCSIIKNVMILNFVSFLFHEEGRKVNFPFIYQSCDSISTAFSTLFICLFILCFL